jgi:hypothetical protein
MAPHGRFSEPAATSRPARARSSRLNRPFLARPHRTGRPYNTRPPRPDGSHGDSSRASGAHDPPIYRMLQVCDSVNAVRAFFGPVAAQVLGRPEERISHKSPRGRHCAGPSVGRGSAERVSRPSAGVVVLPERAVPGRWPAVGRVGSHDGRVGARASRGIPGPCSMLSRAGPCRPNPVIRPGWRGMPANVIRAFGPTWIAPL